MTTAPKSRRSFEHFSVVAFCIIAPILLSAPWEGTAGEIYKSVDAKGQVTYSDKPSPHAERIYLRTDPKLSDADRARMATEQEARTRAEEDRDRKADAAKREQAQRAQTEQTRREQCRQARNRYLMFTESGRLYRRDEQGNRVYYTSAEIDA